MASLPRSHAVFAPVASRKAPSAAAFIGRMLSVWRQRQHLDRLDAHMRRDIGLSEAETRSEVHRQIWDVPQTWRL